MKTLIRVAVALPLFMPPLPADAQDATPDARPLARQPFLGMRVRDSEQGVVVGWIYPGPLGGNGFDSTSGVKRGDTLIAVGPGETLNDDTRVVIHSAAQYTDFESTLVVGQTLTIELRRSPDANPDASVPTGGQGGEHVTVSVTVGSREDWTGTIGRDWGGRTFAPTPEGDYEHALLDAMHGAGLLDEPEGPSKLVEYLAQVQQDTPDANALPCVVRSFNRPMSVDAVEGEILGLVHAAASGNPADALELVRTLLDLPEPGSGLPFVGDMATREQGERLVRTLRDSVYVYDQHARDHLRVIHSARPHFDNTLPRVLGFWDVMKEWEDLGRDNTGIPPKAPVPERIRALVDGDVLTWIEFPNGTIGIVGGPGPNTYHVGGPLADVYDTGGDDTYEFAHHDKPVFGNHHIIDIAGNDTYTSDDDFAGPGVAFWSMSVVDDRAGNDTYRTTGQGSIAFGLFGVGLLIDHEGDDTYENIGPRSGWSIGAGFYGCGLLIDRAGNDTYLGEQLCQGVGGPRGVGMIIDAAGDDSYKANGPSFGSVYGTEGVYKGFCQGFGIGVRGYAAGGLGAIYDLAGDDRYESGEFAQGCAYYYSMGVLHDTEGDDQYVGNRYGQGSAAHQAIGVLIDDAGDDSYWSMTAASQAGVWDQSIAFLIDRGGDDTYEADGLAQGSAAMQALAVLIDAGGNDTYTGRGASCQGQGGSNEYHYDADRVYSFSALLDLGGQDSFSRTQPEGSVVRTGEGHSDPAKATFFGVLVDRE